MNAYYERLLRQPKRPHLWPGYDAAGILPPGANGLDIFLDSLGGLAPEFYESLRPASLEQAMRADDRIVLGSQLMRRAAVLPYNTSFPNVPALSLWAGLALFQEQQFGEAAQYLLSALQSHQIVYPERIFWYLALASAGCQDVDTMRTAIEAFEAQATDRSLALSLTAKVPGNGEMLLSANVFEPVFRQGFQ